MVDYWVLIFMVLEKHHTDTKKEELYLVYVNANSFVKYWMGFNQYRHQNRI